MYITTKYEIGDTVALPYTVPTPGAGMTRAIIPGEIKSVLITETINDEGTNVTIIEYGVFTNSEILSVETFLETDILCEIASYKNPYLEKLARKAGFITRAMKLEILIAERDEKEKLETLVEAEEKEYIAECAERKTNREAKAIEVSPGGEGDPE